MYVPFRMPTQVRKLARVMGGVLPREGRQKQWCKQVQEREEREEYSRKNMEG